MVPIRTPRLLSRRSCSSSGTRERSGTTIPSDDQLRSSLWLKIQAAAWNTATPGAIGAAV